MNLWRGNPFVSHAGVVIVALACASCRAPAGTAPASEARAGRIESDAITCWWKTDTDAVRIGQPFALALTCDVADAETMRVVVDPARLDPAVIDVRPFEVLDGARRRDVPAPSRRSFQYQYRLRILSDEFFGRDVDVPALPLSYRVQTAGGDTAQGPEQVYVLPALPVRVLSLVPVTATDIHDSPPDVFADIESRSVRAAVEFAVAGVFLVCTVTVGGLTAARAMRRSATDPKSAVPLPPRVVVQACLREAERVQQEGASGWTPDLMGRALSVFRIAAAAASGRSIAETPVDRDDVPGDGQFALRRGAWRPQLVIVSASATAATVAASLGGDNLDPERRAALEDLAVPLQVLTDVQYGRSEHASASVVGDAVASGIRGLRRLNAVMRGRFGSLRWPQALWTR